MKDAPVQLRCQIHNDQRRADDGRFQRRGAAGDDSQIRRRYRVVRVVFNQINVRQMQVGDELNGFFVLSARSKRSPVKLDDVGSKL